MNPELLPLQEKNPALKKFAPAEILGPPKGKLKTEKYLIRSEANGLVETADSLDKIMKMNSERNENSH